MKNKLIFYTGLIGVALFVVSSIAGGLLLEGYSFTRQYISESYAIDTEYGLALRIFGYIPSGILIAIFCFLGARYFQPSKQAKIGFYGFGIFYGLATVIVAIFPCDSGCARDFTNPSVSQAIHNLAGILTYIFVPPSIILMGMGMQQLPDFKNLAVKAFICGFLCIPFIYFLITSPDSDYSGLYQRIIETLFIIWILICATAIKNTRFEETAYL